MTIPVIHILSTKRTSVRPARLNQQLSFVLLHALHYLNIIVDHGCEGSRPREDE